MPHWGLSSVGLAGIPLGGLFGTGGEATEGSRDPWLGTCPHSLSMEAAGCGAGPAYGHLWLREYIWEYGAEHQPPSPSRTHLALCCGPGTFLSVIRH